MIRLRHLLERGCAHPILGPIILVALVLLLAMVLVHAVHDGMDVAEVGAICVAIASFFGLAVLGRLDSSRQEARGSTPDERGPPLTPGAAQHVPVKIATTSFSTPLRR